MATLGDLLDENRAHFARRIKRSAQVAREQIAAEGPDAPISDEARLRALNILSYALHRADAWGEARDLLLAMSTKMEMAGYREDWLVYLMAGLRLSQEQADRTAEAALHFHCGHLQRLMSHNTEAAALLRTSAALYADLGDKPGEARALNQLAYLAWQQQRYEDAESFILQALDLVENGSLEQAVSFSVSGLVAIDQNRPHAAEKFHSAALQIRTQQADQRLMAWSLQNLGVALMQQGIYDKAITCYEQSLSLLALLHDLGYKAIVQLNLAIAYYTLGEAEQALGIIREAEQILHRIFDDFNLAKLFTTKGLCQLALQQWQAAEDTFEASSQLFQKLGNYSWYLNSLDGLGISYLEQENYAKALAIFEFIATQLPQIEGTLPYTYLTSTIPIQLEQVRNKQVKRGHSTYMPPQHQNQQPPGAGPQADATAVRDEPVVPSSNTGT